MKSQSGNDISIQRGVGDRAPCARHPATHTFLRCTACGVAICPSCAEFASDGACCPDCARRQAKGRGQPATPTADRGRLVGALVCGIVIAGLAGVALTLIPARALLVAPLLLMGLTVGEAIGALNRRRGGAVLGMLAFGCASLGPLLGIAIVRAASAQLTGRGLPLATLGVAVGPLDLALLGIAGCLAAWRAGGGRPAGPISR